MKKKFNKRNKMKKQKQVWKKKRKAIRKYEDDMARKANIANGGCFHSYRWVKEQKREERKLKQAIKENTSECITTKHSLEEVESLIAEIEARKHH